MNIRLVKYLLLPSLTLVSLSCFAQNDQQYDSKNFQRKGPPPFNMLDKNSDGMVTLEEFKQHKIPRGQHEEVFSRFDSDGDSVISEQEFNSHKPPRRSSRKSKAM